MKRNKTIIKMTDAEFERLRNAYWEAKFNKDEKLLEEITKFYGATLMMSLTGQVTINKKNKKIFKKLLTNLSGHGIIRHNQKERK